MNFWRFDTDVAYLEPLVASHHHGLALLAVLVAILAASVLLPVIERYRVATVLPSRLGWLGAGALAMGTGVWAMHFTAMLAHRLPVAVSYDPTITLVSMLPIMLATALTIHINSLRIHRHYRLWLGALALGSGVGAMHYIGMEALIAPIYMRYQPSLFMLSVVLAVLLAWLGLYTKITLVRHARRYWLAYLCGSTLLGLAVSAMHYAAMAATVFYPQAEPGVTVGLALEPELLAIMVTLVVTLIVTLLLVATMIDRRVSTISSALYDSENRFKLLSETSESGIFTFQNTFLYCNPALCKITGYSARELRLMSVSQLFDIDLDGLHKMDLHQSFCQELKMTTRVGDQRWLYVTVSRIEAGRNSEFMGNAFDITERKMLEQELRELAFYDRTTGLPNRALFMEQLERQFNRGKGRGYAVLFINVDRFKVVNANFGLDTGDRLLALITQRLRQRLREDDMLARVGGDEFAVLLAGVSDASATTVLAQDIQNSFINPFFVARQELFVSVSMGIAFAHNSYTRAEDIYRDANIAMNTAKRQSKGSSCVFDAGMQHLVQARLQLETDLRRALERKSFELYYQPIVALGEDNPLQGFEALLRWRRPDGSYVPPSEFIPLAEESGLISPLGNWVLETACQQLEDWNQHIPGFAERGYISINVSTPQFFQSDWLTNVTFLIHRHQLRPGQLRMELTEGILMEDSAQLIGKLKELRALGCPIMIDDFGTGYSSLSYLHRFPVSVIKIDQSFIRQINSSDTSRHLVQAIISMAHALELQVVAEGIEDREIMALLTDMGCESGQGYLFSRPVPAEAAEQYLLKQAASLSR